MDDSERRQHHRFRLWLPTRIASSGREVKLAIGHDMSQSGALLVTDSELPLGASVTLSLRLPPDADAALELQAVVVRTGPNQEDPEGLWPFQAAVKFENTSPRIEKLLREQTVMLEGVADTDEQRR